MNKDEKKKKQQMRISDSELEIIKSTFAERDELLKTIRNLFLGLSVTDDEKRQIKDLFGTSEVLRNLMRKQFLPEIQPDLPIGQAIDLWMTIDLKDKDIGQIRQIVEAREKLIGLIEKSLNLLEDPNETPVDLSSWSKVPWAEGTDTSLIARNQFISHIDQQLNTIKILAGMKTETVEETKKRLLQDSSK